MEIHFNNIRNNILKQIDLAEKEINIAVAWFTNLELFTSVINKLSQGVEVNIIIINDYINNGDYGLNFQNFVDKGGKLFYGEQENPMHNKFCIIDEKILINGSYNWTYYAESRNKGNIFITDNSEVVREYSNEFKELKNNLKQVAMVSKLVFSQNLLADNSSIKQYVSMDYFLRGKEINEPNLIKKAFEIAPNNKEFEKNKILLASNISKHNKKLQQSIGVHIWKEQKDNQYLDNRYRKIININSKIPVESSISIGIHQDYQQFAEVKICHGEKELFSQNTQISSFKFKLQPQLIKDAKGKISTTFMINSKGVLKVHVIDTKNGNSMTMKYDISYLIK